MCGSVGWSQAVLCDESASRNLACSSPWLAAVLHRRALQVVGSGKCCVCDTWFQTETGGARLDLT